MLSILVVVFVVMFLQTEGIQTARQRVASVIIKTINESSVKRRMSMLMRKPSVFAKSARVHSEAPSSYSETKRSPKLPQNVESKRINETIQSQNKLEVIEETQISQKELVVKKFSNEKTA